MDNFSQIKEVTFHRFKVNLGLYKGHIFSLEEVVLHRVISVSVYCAGERSIREDGFRMAIPLLSGTLFKVKGKDNKRKRGFPLPNSCRTIILLRHQLGFIKGRSFVSLIKIFIKYLSFTLSLVTPRM